MLADPLFSTKCLSMCRQLVCRSEVMTREEEVVGRDERYTIVHVAGAYPFQVYVYTDGAGVMRGHDGWCPFEAPDYATAEALVAALRAEIESALEGP